MLGSHREQRAMYELGVRHGVQTKRRDPRLFIIRALDAKSDTLNSLSRRSRRERPRGNWQKSSPLLCGRGVDLGCVPGDRGPCAQSSPNPAARCRATRRAAVVGIAVTDVFSVVKFDSPASSDSNSSRQLTTESAAGSERQAACMKVRGVRALPLTIREAPVPGIAAEGLGERNDQEPVHPNPDVAALSAGARCCDTYWVGGHVRVFSLFHDAAGAP